MERYTVMADELLNALDEHPHMPPESLNNTMRGEIAVLRLLNGMDTEMSAGYISRELHMTTSRIAAVLNSLEKKSMIERAVDVHDRRRIIVRLTDKGKTHCLAHYAEVRSRITTLLSILGEKDAAEFTRLVKSVFDISSHLEQPPRAISDTLCEKNDTEKYE